MWDGKKLLILSIKQRNDCEKGGAILSHTEEEENKLNRGIAISRENEKKGEKFFLSREYLKFENCPVLVTSISRGMIYDRKIQNIGI